MTDPTLALTPVALFALLVAFSSATQDIAIDAYRIEAVTQDRQAAMAATYILGYRVALLAAGAGAFYVAEYASGRAPIFAMATLMVIGMTTVVFIAEPAHHREADDFMFETARDRLHVAFGAPAQVAEGGRRLVHRRGDLPVRRFFFRATAGWPSSF